MSPIKNVTLFELEVLAQAAQYPSIRSLSRHLGLEASHLSKILARLEQKVDVKLFRRSQAGILLTRDGEGIVHTAVNVLAAARPLLDSTTAAGVAAPVVVTIGSLSFLNRTVITRAVTSLAVGAPRHRFRLVDNAPDLLAISALKGAFDLIVHYRRDEWGQAWAVSEVGMLRWGLYARREHPITSGCDEAEILPFPFVVPTYWGERQFMAGNDLCPVPWTRRIKGHETATADGAIQIVLGSDQLAFLPDCAVGPFEAELRCITVHGWPTVQRKLYTMVNKDSVKGPLATRFMRALQAALP